MNSILISFLVILLSVLMCEINVILLVSLIFLVFILNVFIVSKIVSKCKQNDLKVHSNELKSNQINNSNYYYYNSVIYYIKKPFIHLTAICFDFTSNKVSNYLLKVEKTLSEKPFCGKCLDFKNELSVVSHLITDNYVEFWYKSIGTDNKDFENDCQLILQKMFSNLFERCEQKLDKQMFCQKFVILLENHLNDTKSMQKLSSFDLNESQRIDSIIGRVIQLTATEDITCVLSNQNSGRKAKDLSLVLMIKAMLSHSVFLPIIDIITEQKFIYENLFYLITNSELKLNDNNKIEYQLKNTNQINELFSCGFKYQIQTIDTIDTTDTKSEDFYDEKLMKQISNSEEDDFKTFDLNDLSGNESNDELIVEAIEAEEEINEKLISNLVITKTEEINDLYNSSYILYFIEYDGLFRQSLDSNISGSSSDQRICFIRRRVSVKRRFSEFVSLQKVLERNKTFKRSMKGIKKPSSIQITAQNLLAFAGSANTRLDSSTLEFRRIYLQNFLNQLSNLKAISESVEFLLFLAYGSDGSIAFVSNNSDNNLPLSIDKVFYRGFKGAMSIMRSALPVAPQIGKIDPEFSERTIPESEKLTIKSIATNFESNNCMQLEKKLNIWFQTDSDLTFIDSIGSKGDDPFTKHINSDNTYLQKSLGTRTLGDGCEDPIASELIPINNPSNEKVYQRNSSPGIHTINCLLLLITNNVESIEKIIYTKIIALIFGTTIERFITELVSKLVSKEMFVRHIHSLHTAIWPTNESEVQNECKVQNTNCLDQTVDALYCYMKCRLDSISPHIPYILDKLSIEHFLANILIKFKDCNKNKLFFYEFCELFLDEIE